VGREASQQSEDVLRQHDWLPRCQAGRSNGLLAASKIYRCQQEPFEEEMFSRSLTLATIIAIAVSGVTAVRADDRQNAYDVDNLVSDLPNRAAVQDPNLKNAWGDACSPAASPFWITDNATGLSTLYDADGTTVPLVVTIPCPPAAGQGSSCPQNAAPSGMVWNPTTGVSTAFLVPGTKLPGSFIFGTEDGTISAWASGLTPANNAVLAVNDSVTPNAALGAVYTGLAIGVNVNGVFLFATNFAENLAFPSPNPGNAITRWLAY
jgi:hypothetical protein